ncbi:MAG: glycosyltransferase family 4 protein [Bacteroidia bacterium]
MSTPGRKTIVAVHLLNDFSGSPLVFSQALRALQKEGHEVIIHTSRWKEGFLNKVPARFVGFPYRFYSNTLMRLTAFLFSQVYLFFQLLHYRKTDAVIYVNTMLPFGAALAGAVMGKKVVYHLHESYIRPAALKGFLRFIAAKTADKILYVSGYLEREERINGVDGTVVYNAVSDEFIHQAAAHQYSQQPEKTFMVLMVCSLKDYKGIPEFLRLAARHPQLKFEMVINATDTDIRQYFSKHTVPQNFVWHPVQRNLDTFYRRASLVVNLTNPDQCIETFGMTILEAMCYGIPVIAPPVGGPTELVQEQQNGFTIDVRDEATLDFRLQYLAENPEFMEQLSEGARKTAERFTAGQFNKEIIRNF